MWDGDCGNGKTPNGTQITGNDPTDTSMSANASYMGNWVSYLKNRFGAANENGVRFYAYDNEPSGWANTHRDIHPEAPTYQEIRDRTYAYGAAIKAADPTAKTMGPIDFGWAVYVGNPDNTNGLWYDKWYLQEMRKYEEENGIRISIILPRTTIHHLMVLPSLMLVTMAWKKHGRGSYVPSVVGSHLRRELDWTIVRPHSTASVIPQLGK